MRKNLKLIAKMQLDSLADVLELLYAKFDELEKDREKKDKKICELEKKIESTFKKEMNINIREEDLD